MHPHSNICRSLVGTTYPILHKFLKYYYVFSKKTKDHDSMCALHTVALLENAAP